MMQDALEVLDARGGHVLMAIRPGRPASGQIVYGVEHMARPVHARLGCVGGRGGRRGARIAADPYAR